MKRAWVVARSIFLWTVSWIHFIAIVNLVLGFAALVGQRRIDPLLRWGARNIMRLAGARLKVHVAPGVADGRTCFFASNHVNLFDPFVLYASIPRHFRGLELESHFRIPVYGWLMKRFGNVPVPDARTPSGLKRTYRLAREALDAGTSLLVFPEGGRTLDGRVAEFESGVFRMAVQLGYPITPVSIVGAYEWQRKGSWLLRPATVEVFLHETIETQGLGRGDLAALQARIHAIVTAPVEAHHANC